MKKLFILMLFLPAISHAGTITTSFLSSAGTITISSGTSANWRFIQGSTSTATSCGSTISTITVTAGDFLVAGCYSDSNLSGITLTDTASDSWLVATSTSADASHYMSINYVKSAVGGSTYVTAATNGCNGHNACVLLEYSGQNTTSPYDVTSGSAPVLGSATPAITTLSTTTTSTNELMVAFAEENNGSGITGQNGTARTMTPATGGNVNVWSQDTVLATPQSHTSTWTEVTTYTWMTLQAAFKGH